MEKKLTGQPEMGLCRNVRFRCRRSFEGVTEFRDIETHICIYRYM